MRSVLSRGLLLLILVATLGGCGLRASGGTPPDPPTPMQVLNNSPLDMRIYVVLGGQRTRVGIANAHATSTLAIPARIIGDGREVSFIVDPVGRRGQTQTYRIFVRPGERVQLNIPGHLR